MFKDIITNKLKAMQKPIVSTGRDFIMTACLNPQHNDSKPSFFVNTTTGYGKCFSCSFSINKDFWINGKISEELLEEIERDTKYYRLLKKKDEEYQKVIAIPPRDKEVLGGYRGLTQETINSFGLYECHTGRYKGRVVIPLSDNYFDTRAIGDAQPKYLRSKGYKTDKYTFPYKQLQETRKEFVVVVEGVFDCISLWQDNIPSICNFGVSKCNINIAHLIEAGITDIFVMFDNDEAGIKATESMLHNTEVQEYFSVYHARTLKELRLFYESSCKDYNEYMCSKNGL